jgi:hypothetical protein
MKTSETKGNYSELYHSVEREFFNSELNKLVDRKPLLTKRLTSDSKTKAPEIFQRKPCFILQRARKATTLEETASPIVPSRDSSLLAPTSTLKPMRKTTSRRKNKRKTSTDATLASILNKEEDYTVGEMFSELDYPQPHHRRESIAEATGRTQAPEQPYNRYIEDSAYKSTGSKLASLQPTYAETTTPRLAAQEVSRF